MKPIAEPIAALEFSRDDVGVEPWSTRAPYKDALGAERRDGGDDPRDEPPPVIYGEEIKSGCSPIFVDGIRNNDCDPRGRDTNVSLSGTITGFIWPGSRWLGAVRDAVAEINRSFEFFASVCINLRLEQLRVEEAKLRQMRAWFRIWYAQVVDAVGGEDHLGPTTIPTGLVDAFRGTMANFQESAQEAGAKLLVIFIDEYVTDYRPSLGSANRRNGHQIGINWVDHGSRYILAHELVHAFGKSNANTPGPKTWAHECECPRALTRITRAPADRTPVNLSGRLLDVSEYEEIVTNRGGDVLRG
jgi:hypothetical protein